MQAVVALYAGLNLARIKTVRGTEATTLFLGPPSSGSSSALENQRYALASQSLMSQRMIHLSCCFTVTWTTPCRSSSRSSMQTALKKAGVTVEFVPIHGGRHGRNFGFELGDRRLPDYIGTAIEWFNTHLQVRPPNTRLQPAAPTR